MWLSILCCRRVDVGFTVAVAASAVVVVVAAVARCCFCLLIPCVVNKMYAINEQS